MKRTTSVVSLLLLAGQTSGCYVQRPLETPVPAPQMRIVAQVTDSGAVAVGSRLGPGAVQVEGVVATADESAWNLKLLRVDYRGGTSNTWNRELVTFPRFALSNATERRVNKTRSWLLAGLIGAGAILASQLFSEFSSGEGDDGEQPPQNTLTLPIRF
jgi:hypothetical protein